MTVAKLREQLLSLADREPAGDPANGTVRAVADAIARFGEMSLATFAGLLDKVRIPAPKRPVRPRKSPDDVARDKAAKDAAKAAAAEAKRQEKDRVAREKVEQKRLEQSRKAAEKARLDQEKAEQKRLAREQKERAKGEPSPEVRRLAADLNDLIDRAGRERATYAEIDAHVARLNPLTKPQVLQVAKLIESDAGLGSKTKPQIVAALRDVIRRVLGTAERVKM